MFENQASFLRRTQNEVAICGNYIPFRDSAHAALFWRFNGVSQIVEFNRGDQILVTDASSPTFRNYYFNPLPAFPPNLIPSLAAVSRAIAGNLFNDFTLSINNVVYAGGEFRFVDGGFIPVQSLKRLLRWLWVLLLGRLIHTPR